MPSLNAIFRNFNRAKGVCACSDFPRQKIGCVIVEGNKVISVGYNQAKSNPKQKEYNRYRNFRLPKKVTPLENNCHAEMMALSKIWTRKNENWSRASIYIYRESKNGELKLAKPCNACAKAIIEFGIGHVYYTTEGGFNHETLQQFKESNKDLPLCWRGHEV